MRAVDVAGSSHASADAAERAGRCRTPHAAPTPSRRSPTRRRPHRRRRRARHAALHGARAAGAASRRRARSDLYSLGVAALRAARPARRRIRSATPRGAARRGARRAARAPVGELAPDAPPRARADRRCAASRAIRRERPESADELRARARGGCCVDAPAVPEGNPYRGPARVRGRAPRAVLRPRRRRQRARRSPAHRAAGRVAGDSGHRQVVAVPRRRGARGARRRARRPPRAGARSRSSPGARAVRPRCATRSALADGRDAPRVRRWCARCGRADGDGRARRRSISSRSWSRWPSPREAARVAELLAAIADGVPGVKALLVRARRLPDPRSRRCPGSARR